MSRVRRTAAVLFTVAVALAPLTTSANSRPNPSLDTVLAAPPQSDFTELTTSPLHGTFTAHDWASLSGSSSDAQQTEATLNRDGFVEGFGMTWRQATSGHTLLEAVMAFRGGRGAQSALNGMEASDKADASYTKADRASGINFYYGAHFVDASNQVIEDFFAFVKGNDIFGIAFVSNKDDVLDDATRQIESQYSRAPGLTIPMSEWPENANPMASFPIAVVGAGLGFVVVIVGLIAFFLLRRRPSATQGIYASFAPALSLQMSPDGHYWWDGTAWRDATQDVPPQAQRSSDGAYWWDGARWRPVPQPPVS